MAVERVNECMRGRTGGWTGGRVDDSIRNGQESKNSESKGGESVEKGEGGERAMNKEGTKKMSHREI